MILLPLLFLLSPGFGKASAQNTWSYDPVTVPEGEDALLPCALSSGQNIKNFDWRKDNGEKEMKEVFIYRDGKKVTGQSEQFADRVRLFEEELKFGNASIKIKSTRLEDNGTYICVLLEPRSPHVTVRLNVAGVLKKRNISGASPLPYVDQIHLKNGLVHLDCKAHGVPKPEVEWTDSSRKALTAENKHVEEYEDASGRFHVEVQVNVTRSDTYNCVVTQEGIKHQIIRPVTVHIPDNHILLVFVGVLGVLLLCAILGLCYCAYKGKYLCRESVL